MACCQGQPTVACIYLCVCVCVCAHAHTKIFVFIYKLSQHLVLEGGGIIKKAKKNISPGKQHIGIKPGTVQSTVKCFTHLTTSHLEKRR